MISFLRSIIEKTCSAKKIHASIIHLCNALVCFSKIIVMGIRRSATSLPASQLPYRKEFLSGSFCAMIRL